MMMNTHLGYFAFVYYANMAEISTLANGLRLSVDSDGLLLPGSVVAYEQLPVARARGKSRGHYLRQK